MDKIEQFKGIIIKGIGGFYYVKTSNGYVYECKARGLFKKKGITPMVGDNVTGEVQEDGTGFITKIEDRKNSFIRPPISNVDVLVVVYTVKNPEISKFILDKFLVMAEESHVEPIICINKVEFLNEEEIQEIKRIYEPIYKVHTVSAKEGIGLDALKEELKGKRFALAGPSGVGKSSLINLLIPHAESFTGEISEKTSRGKHTTRHVEIFSLDENTMIYDTPGFTSFEVIGVDENELDHLFPEIAKALGNCKYDNCRHFKEPKCHIIEEVENGNISKERYDSYLSILKQIREEKKW